MSNATLPMLGTKYDYGQLLNIAMNVLLGYEFEEKTKVFDFGAKRKVCSVGIAAIFQKWRKALETQGTIVPRLFGKLNEGAWDKDFINRFKQKNRWDIENTFPAQFGLSQSHFGGEFKLVLKMNKGKIKFLNPNA
jgi:hypothetical protein